MSAPVRSLVMGFLVIASAIVSNRDELAVTSGDCSLAAFIQSTDNGTGDTILLVD